VQAALPGVGSAWLTRLAACRFIVGALLEKIQGAHIRFLFFSLFAVSNLVRFSQIARDVPQLRWTESSESTQRKTLIWRSGYVSRIGYEG
jgi:hypothetical protein